LALEGITANATSYRSRSRPQSLPRPTTTAFAVPSLSTRLSPLPCPAAHSATPGSALSPRPTRVKAERLGKVSWSAGTLSGTQSGTLTGRHEDASRYGAGRQEGCCLAACSPPDQGTLRCCCAPSSSRTGIASAHERPGADGVTRGQAAHRVSGLGPAGQQQGCGARDYGYSHGHFLPHRNAARACSLNRSTRRT